MTLLSYVALGLAMIPCGLFALNLLAYRRLPAGVIDEGGLGGGELQVSVLIPARNEERNIGPTLEAVLANRGCEYEVVVLDDHSTDGTAAAVEAFSRRDPRVRLEKAPALPEGWSGKQHACYHLAGLARSPLLLFLDADVRLRRDALCRMNRFMERSGVALASGIPRQETGTWLEILLIPLIHFVLLGYLPIAGMRRSKSPAMSGGCGQLFLARRDAYVRCGGHSKLRESFHDGVRLPRVFRSAGMRTDLFDATDIGVCRMYRTNREVWDGLGKNSTEGLGAPGVIVPMTVLLAGGQILPFLLLAGSAGTVPGVVALAAVLSLLPRLVSCWRFGQPLAGALLHPVGVLLLLVIQWRGWVLARAGVRPVWRGRNYEPIDSNCGEAGSSVLP